MRNLATLLLLVLALPACQGTEPLLTTRGAPPQFAAVPAPSELPWTGQQPADPSAAKTTSYITRMPGDLLAADLPHPNCEPSPDLPLATRQGLAGELSYFYFRSPPGGFEPFHTLSAIYVDGAWVTEAPAAPEGVYVGLPDHDAEAWTWIGPLEVRDQWTDVHIFDIEGREGVDYFVVVNYSAQDLAFYALCYRLVCDDTVKENSWIYYAGYDAAEPDSRTSIWRIQPQFSTTPEKVLPGTEDRAYTDPRIAFFGEDAFLAYARQEGEDPSGIWRATLDGTSTQSLWTHPTTNYKPGCWNEAGTRCTYLQLAPTGRYNLYGKVIGEPVQGLLTRDTDNVDDPWWDPSSWLDFGVVFTLILEMPAHSVIAQICTDGDPPLAMAPEILLELDQTNLIHPCPFVIINGLGQTTTGITFSMAAAGETMDAYWFDIDAPSLIWQLVVDPARDIVGPAVSPEDQMLAFVSVEPGEDDGELHVMDFVSANGDYDDATLLADGVVPQFTWYDP